jgi:poly-gamma-glutamate capsule biosynthesis protein CapA/YwtB (metallophosphatase superfamily)/predicted small secreted protein
LIKSLSMKKYLLIFITFLLLSIVTLSACKSNQDIGEDIQVEHTTAVPDVVNLSVPPYLPEKLVNILREVEPIFVNVYGNGIDARLDVSSEDPVFEWVYVLAAPFSYIGEGVNSADLKAFWQGGFPSGFPFEKIFLDGSTKAVLEKLWGSASINNVIIVSSEELLNKTWETKNTIAILQFNQLEPAWKVLPIDGESPIDKHFIPQDYILTIPFSLLGEQDQRDILKYILEKNFIKTKYAPASNRNEDKMTTVITTGVTALARGTAYMMETYGLTYPAIDIADVLRDADILHVSNEIPFTDTCPAPYANKYNDANLMFCSKPEYIQLLEAIGTDVVELTGDHFRDWGADAMLGTLDMYDQRGWQYYGGGRNLNDAIQPALFNHNGNKIAFFGCNAKPPGYATASETSPGAVHCDMELMAEQVKNAVDQGFLPIFTFQHLEYYTYKRSPALQPDFHLAADAGSVIVSGSQAHQPHAMEFYKNSFLHYGLGNLFFDQYDESFSQRQAFLDRHVFFDGKHISTELIPIMFIDLARSRIMTQDEEYTLLNNVFTASGW